jgi:hypothetical protein
VADPMAEAALNCAGAYQFPVVAMGKPWARWDVWGSDLGVPASIPPNNATLLRPLEPSRVADVRARLDELFSRSGGGPYHLWSFWPLPAPPGDVEPFEVPCMVRPAGGTAPPPPKGLEVVEVSDLQGLRHVGRILSEAFEVTPAEEDFYDERVLGSDAFRIWLGLADGRPVSTSCAFVDERFVGVYAVATVTAAWGRGYGEALTWVATMCRPDLPATLQASDMGRPIYERMGFDVIARCAVWELPRPFGGRG